MLMIRYLLVEWVVDLVSKFCKAQELVLNTCATTLVTAKRCSQLPDPHRFEVFEKNFAYSQDVMPSFVELYAKHVLSPLSDIDESREAVNASNLFQGNGRPQIKEKGWSLDFVCWTCPCADIPGTYNVLYWECIQNCNSI